MFVGGLGLSVYLWVGGVGVGGVVRVFVGGVGGLCFQKERKEGRKKETLYVKQ